MGIALTGMLTRPMLMLPDQVGWLGIGSRFSSSSAGATSSLGGFNLGIQIKGFDEINNFSLCIKCHKIGGKEAIFLVRIVYCIHPKRESVVSSED